MSSFLRKLVDRLVVREWLDLPAAQKNTAGGIVVADSEGKIVGPIIPRSGTKAEIDGIVLGLGEVAYYTDVTGHAVGDGVTEGGWPTIVKKLTSPDSLGSQVLSIDYPANSDGQVWQVDGCVVLGYDAVTSLTVSLGYGVVGAGQLLNQQNERHFDGSEFGSDYSSESDPTDSNPEPSWIHVSGIRIIDSASAGSLNLAVTGTGTNLSVEPGTCLVARRIA